MCAKYTGVVYNPYNFVLWGEESIEEKKILSQSLSVSVCVHAPDAVSLPQLKNTACFDIIPLF